MKLKDIVNKVKIDSRKLTQYALNLDNPKGLNKALMFQSHLGYTQDNYEPLLQQIANKALEANAVYQSTDSPAVFASGINGAKISHSASLIL